MASWEELQFFLAHGSTTRRLREDARLEHLHRTSTRTRSWEELVILAFDHRMYLLFIAVVTFRSRGLFGKKSVLDA